MHPLEDSSAHQASAEELGLLLLRLLRLLSPLRVKSLSLHDAAAEVIWLSEGAFGPDEHAYTLDALDAFTLDASSMQWLRTLDDGRRALFLAARDAEGERRGVALAMLDGSGAQPDERLAHAPRIAAVMRRFSVLLTRGATPSAPVVAEAAAASASAIAAHAPHVRQYVRLRPGGATRRYELAPRGASGTPEELKTLAWLLDFINSPRAHATPTSYALPLSMAAVLEPEFVTSAQDSMAAAHIGPDQIGFCLPASVWSQHIAATERFSAACSAMNCFIALDDFSWGSGTQLLAAPAVRCLKLDTQITTHAATDKFAQAMLAATVQAARVLGLYCVAKQIESIQVAKWLSRAGVEFADRLPRSADATATRRAHFATLD